MQTFASAEWKSFLFCNRLRMFEDIVVTYVTAVSEFRKQKIKKDEMREPKALKPFAFLHTLYIQSMKAKTFRF